MVEKMNIFVGQANSPRLFAYLLERKKEGINYVDALTQLVEENDRLNDTVVKQNDWTGMRLALRATEKNSHIILEMLNNLFLSRPLEPVASHSQKSPNLLYFEADWKAYIEGLQAERSSHKAHKKETPKTAGSKLPMPSFDFEEEG